MYSLPADRQITWLGNVGIVGNIPARATYTTLSPSGGNDSTAINAALTACPAGQAVVLGAGTFLINAQINVKNGVTLRGMGRGLTTLVGQSGMTGYYIVGINGSPSYGTSYNITSSTLKGTTTITTASASGWSIGDIVLVDQLNDTAGAYGPIVTIIGTNGSPGATWASRASGTRVCGQVNRIASISGTSVTLELPLYWDYASALTPQLTRIQGIYTASSIEHLSVDNQTSQVDPALEMYGVTGCWLLDVEINGSWQNGIVFQKAYRNLIRGCVLHEGIPALPPTGSQYATSRAYGIYMNVASANVVEVTEFYHLDMTSKMDGPTSGNVIAYNYAHDIYYSPSMTWQSDAFSMHGGHPRMNLFEGNIGMASFEADNVWGSASHNVLFRNRFTLDQSRPKRAFDIALYSMSADFSSIGNVLGTTGFETSYTTSTANTNVQAIYGMDPAISGTLLAHGNWDSIHNGVVWNGADDHTLPASLYLATAPEWWGVPSFPVIGPDVSPMSPATWPWAGGIDNANSLTVIGSGGGVAAGTATYLRNAVLIGAGGGTAGGSADVELHQAITTVIGTGGGVSGGTVALSYGQIILPTGGAVAGGEGTFGSVLTFEMIVDGGGVAGGTADTLFGRAYLSTGGAIAGGEASIETSFPVVVIGSGGGVAEGTAVFLLDREIMGTGGGVAGRTALQEQDVVGTGGAVAGGETVFLWQQSASSLFVTMRLWA